MEDYQVKRIYNLRNREKFSMGRKGECLTCNKPIIDEDFTSEERLKESEISFTCEPCQIKLLPFNKR